MISRKAAIILLLTIAAVAMLWWASRPRGSNVGTDECRTSASRVDADSSCSDTEPVVVAREPDIKRAPAPPQDTFDVRGRTVLAFFPVTQAEADSSFETNEALADYQHYLPGIMSGLAACLVKTVVTYDSVVWISREGVVEAFRPVQAGYMLMNPGLPDSVVGGVQVHTELLTLATEYFQLAPSCWHNATSGA